MPLKNWKLYFGCLQFAAWQEPTPAATDLYELNLEQHLVISFATFDQDSVSNANFLQIMFNCCLNLI